ERLGGTKEKAQLRGDPFAGRRGRLAHDGTGASRREPPYEGRPSAIRVLHALQPATTSHDRLSGPKRHPIAQMVAFGTPREGRPENGQHHARIVAIDHRAVVALKRPPPAPHGSGLPIVHPGLW